MWLPLWPLPTPPHGTSLRRRRVVDELLCPRCMQSCSLPVCYGVVLCRLPWRASAPPHVDVCRVARADGQPTRGWSSTAAAWWLGVAGPLAYLHSLRATSSMEMLCEIACCRRMFSTVLDVLEVCCKCFTWMLHILQWLYMHVASVCSKCFIYFSDVCCKR
jgi:hypothetical protein